MWTTIANKPSGWIGDRMLNVPLASSMLPGILLVKITPTTELDCTFFSVAEGWLHEKVAGTIKEDLSP